MPDEDDDLKLNTLNRFAKKSAKLALEEYSHCEVPAGCGGVVLRWTDPDEGKPAILLIAAVGSVAGFLDGKLLETGRALIGAGDHVLAISLEQGADLLPSIAPEAGGVLKAIANVLRPLPPRALRSADLFALVLAEDVGRMDRRPLDGVATAGDGTWRVLAAESAPEGWAEPGFDASAWPALLAAGEGAVDRLPENDSPWRLRDVERAGARALVLPASTSRKFWIRRSFRIEERE